MVRVWDPKLQAWVTRFDAGGPHDLGVDRVIRHTSYNIPPIAPLPILMSGGKFAVARWGFPVERRTIFNTRIEGAATSPMWRPLLGQAHAVVPARGFYEWDHAGMPSAAGKGSNQPYFVTRSDGDTMAFAALVGTRVVDGQPKLCASIVTCAPNDAMAPLHDRMPVILAPHEVTAWLSASVDVALELARPCPASDLALHRVSTRVNKVANDDHRLVNPFLGLDAFG